MTPTSSPVEPTPQPLPDLHQADLTPETLEALVQDITACAQVLEVIPKQRETNYVPESAILSLSDGVGLLKSGQLIGLQVRYTYQDATWWDTIIRSRDGFRLVRIRHEFAEDNAGLDHRQASGVNNAPV